MMLLKRLLLPGKGDAIICILILLNVLLWCGELGKDESVEAHSCSISSAFSSYSAFFAVTSSVLSSSKSSLSSKYYGATLVTYYHLISLQSHRVYASEEILVSPSKGPTQQPVFNKTDSLSMTLALKKGEGGATIIASQHNNYNYNKRKRRRPVHNNSSLKSSIHSSVISSNSSNFLSNNDSVLVNKISFSGTGGGSDLVFIGAGSGNSSSSSTVEDVVKLSSDMTDGSELKMSRKANSTMNLKGRKKGRTRNVLHNHHVSKNSNREHSTKEMKKRKPRLLKELTMFNRQNCLSKLLCGVQVAQPPTKSSSALNDYAYLVKAFFDRFSIRGIVTDVIDTAFAYEQDGIEVLDDGEADDEDDDDDDSSKERRLKNSRVKIGNKYIGGAARHKAKRPHNYYHKYNPKYYKEYDQDLDDVALEELLDTDMPDFMEPEILRRRMGRKFVKPFNETECGKCTTGVKRNKGRVLPVDINLIRKKRGMVGEVKRGFMGFFNPRFDKTAYLDKRQLELESTDDTARQLNIAEEIAYRLRSPRQCRLLNWFGNNGNIDSKNTATSPNGMTTTITTITNTGGMVGNLERLNGMQTGLPQNMNTGSGGPGSQVVTVIQQSPVGASNGGPSSNIATTTVKPSSKATVMLNNMGQSASNAMAQAKDVATHLGSTICPFNILELQELILKAQGAPFPHFLTTPPPSPTFVPSQLFSQLQTQPPLPRATLTSATTTTTTTTADPTTTVKATKPPPPASTTAKGKSSGQTRNGLEPGFGYGYDEFSDPEPTPPRYYHRPTAHYLYDSEVTPPSPPHYSYHSTTPRHRVINRRPNQTPRPPPSYYHHTTPVYPTPAYQDDYYDQPDRQTNQPVLIPPVGLADVEEDFREHESYSSYHSGKGASPFERHKVHHNENRQKKPVPKWMTTTTLSPDDLNHYGYDETVPNYSYGTTQKSSGYKIQNQQNYKNPYSRPQKKGYKPGNQPNFDNPFTRDREQQSEYKPGNQPNYKNPFNREQSNGHKRRPSPQNPRNREPPYHNEEPEHVTFKIGPDLPRETTVAPTTNYIREFHNPPVVVDSKTRFPPVGYRQRPAQATQVQQPNAPVRGKPPSQNTGQNRPQPQQNNKSEEDDDDDSDSDSSDESDESSSGEARANMMANNPREPPPGRPDPPTLPPPRSPPPGAPMSMEDEEDESNEAVEKKEVGADDDDDESDEDNESNDENDGKRSYERNDFSKDRVGPPAESNTEKPIRHKVHSSNGDSPVSNGFFSGIFNSFGSITSMFNRNDKDKNHNSAGSISTQLKQSPHLRNHLPPPPPARQNAYPKNVPIKSIDILSASGQESDEEEDDDDDNESDEDEEKVESDKRRKARPKVQVTTTTAKPKKTAAPKKKNREPSAQLTPWVSSNTKMQVFLKTTPVPVIIEASSSWSVKRGHQDEVDDDYDEEYNYNPIESLSDLTKKKKESDADKKTKTKENLYSGLGLSPGLSEFLNDLHQDLSPKKKQKITSNSATTTTVKKPASESVEDDDDDDASDESDEDDVSGPPNRRKMPPRRPPFLPQDPID